MNERYIQRILELEQQAEGIQEDARREAGQLPVRAQREAEVLIEQVRAQAQAEADRLVSQAEAKTECEQILADARDAAGRMETLAMTHFDRAVTFVLDQLVGQEF